MLLALAVAAILFATLRPSPGQDLEEWAHCLICGSRGTADVIVNVILFLPLGAAFVMAGARVRGATILAALLSLGIELTQMWIPGRDPSYGDLLFNTVGGALGAWATTVAPLLLYPGERRAARFSLAVAAAAAGVVGATGYILSPSFPATQYYGQWAANLGHLEQYDGRVLAATLGTIPIPPNRIAETDTVRSLLLGGAPLHITAIAGTPPAALAPLISIYDNHQQEIVLVGPDGDDLVYRFRTHATVLRLDQPPLRAPGALRGTAPGDTLRVAVTEDAGKFCLAVGDDASCGHGFRASEGWALLYFSDSFTPALRVLLGFLWLGMLVFPFGYWFRRGWESVTGGAVLLGALVPLPARLGLLPLSASEWAAVAGFLLLARLARQWVQRRELEPKRTPFHSPGASSEPVSIHR